MDLGFDVVVMLTGITLVFAILVLLMFIITIEGKLFDKANEKKIRKAEQSVVPGQKEPAPAANAVQQPAPAVEAGIPAEIVAVIAAAISAMTGGKYTLRAVRRASNNWGRAGVNDTTSPF